MRDGRSGGPCQPGNRAGGVAGGQAAATSTLWGWDVALVLLPALRQKTLCPRHGPRARLVAGNALPGRPARKALPLGGDLARFARGWAVFRVPRRDLVRTKPDRVRGGPSLGPALRRILFLRSPVSPERDRRPVVVGPLRAPSREAKREPWAARCLARSGELRLQRRRATFPCDSVTCPARPAGPIRKPRTLQVALTRVGGSRRIARMRSGIVLRATLLAAFVLAGAPRDARAGDNGPVIYKWIDENGIAHYTANKDRIPSDVRGRVSELHPGAADAAQPRSDSSESWGSHDATPSGSAAAGATSATPSASDGSAAPTAKPPETSPANPPQPAVSEAAPAPATESPAAASAASAHTPAEKGPTVTGSPGTNQPSPEASESTPTVVPQPAVQNSPVTATSPAIPSAASIAAGPAAAESPAHETPPPVAAGPVVPAQPEAVESPSPALTEPPAAAAPEPAVAGPPASASPAAEAPPLSQPTAAAPLSVAAPPPVATVPAAPSKPEGAEPPAPTTSEPPAAATPEPAPASSSVASPSPASLAAAGSAPRQPEAEPTEPTRTATSPPIGTEPAAAVASQPVAPSSPEPAPTIPTASEPPRAAASESGAGESAAAAGAPAPPSADTRQSAGASPDGSVASDSGDSDGRPRGTGSPVTLTQKTAAVLPAAAPAPSAVEATALPSVDHKGGDRSTASDESTIPPRSAVEQPAPTPPPVAPEAHSQSAEGQGNTALAATEPPTPANRAALDARISALERQIASDQESLKTLLSEIPAPGAPDLADRPEFREIALRLPKLQAELRALQEQRARHTEP